MTGVGWLWPASADGAASSQQRAEAPGHDQKIRTMPKRASTAGSSDAPAAFLRTCKSTAGPFGAWLTRKWRPEPAFRVPVCE